MSNSQKDPIWRALRQMSKTAHRRRIATNLNNYVQQLVNSGVTYVKHTDFHYTLTSADGNRIVDFWPSSNRWMARRIHHRATHGTTNMIRYIKDGDIKALVDKEPSDQTEFKLD